MLNGGLTGSADANGGLTGSADANGGLTGSADANGGLTGSADVTGVQMWIGSRLFVTDLPLCRLSSVGVFCQIHS